MILRFRLKFGGYALPHGDVRPYTLCEHQGARQRALLAEGYLYHPDRIKTLKENREHLEIVREYLEQSIDADLGLTDPIRFRWLLRGIVSFSQLGLHRDSQKAPFYPTVGELFFLLFRTEKADANEVLELASLLNRGIRLDVADYDPEGFVRGIWGLEPIYCGGLHRETESVCATG